MNNVILKGTVVEYDDAYFTVSTEIAEGKSVEVVCYDNRFNPINMGDKVSLKGHLQRNSFAGNIFIVKQIIKLKKS